MKNFVLILISIILVAVIAIGAIHVVDKYFPELSGTTDDAGDDTGDDNGANNGNSNAGNADNGAGDNGGTGDNGNTDNGGNTETPGDDAGEVETLDDLYIYRTISNGSIEFNRLSRKSFAIYVGNGYNVFTNLVTKDANYVGSGDAMVIMPDSGMVFVADTYIDNDNVSIQISNVNDFKNGLVLVYLTDGNTLPLNPPEEFLGDDEQEVTPPEDEPIEPEQPEEPTVTTSTVKASYVPNDNWTVDKNVAGDAKNCSCCSDTSSDVYNVTTRTPAYSNGYALNNGLEFSRSTDNLKSMTFNVHLEADSSKQYKYFPEVTFLDTANNCWFAVQFSVWNNSLNFKLLGSYQGSSTGGFNEVIPDINGKQTSVSWTSTQTDSKGVIRYEFDAMIKIALDGNTLNIYKDSVLIRQMDMTSTFNNLCFDNIEKVCFGFRADDVNKDESIVEYNIGNWYIHNVVLERDEVADKEFYGMVYFDLTMPLTFNMQGYDSIKLKGAQIYTATEDNNLSFTDIYDNYGNVIATVYRDGDNVSMSFNSAFNSYRNTVGLEIEGPYTHLPITLTNL